jgi:hypothetical protein
MNESTPWLSGVDRADYPAVAATERRRAATSGNRDTVGYRAHADRPRQRRDNEAPNASPRVTVRARRFELRESADSGLLTYDGYASVTEAPYEMWDYYGPYTEQVMPGAFTKTLAQVDLDVPLVLQHDALRRIARTTNGTLQLSEDEVGLHVLADQLDPKDADGHPPWRCGHRGLRGQPGNRRIGSAHAAGRFPAVRPDRAGPVFQARGPFWGPKAQGQCSHFGAGNRSAGTLTPAMK